MGLRLLAIVALVATALWVVGCVTITHCTYWNILPAFGIDHYATVCAGGQPTQTERPRFP